MTRMTEPEVKAALERVPPELRRLFIWLVSGQTVTGKTSDGTT